MLTATGIVVVAVTVIFAVIVGILAWAEIHSRDFLAPKE
jgi:hypothetical protein